MPMDLFAGIRSSSTHSRLEVREDAIRLTPLEMDVIVALEARARAALEDPNGSPTNAEFVAAASPTVVLALIAKVRELNASLVATREHADDAPLPDFSVRVAIMGPEGPGKTAIVRAVLEQLVQPGRYEGDSIGYLRDGQLARVVVE